MKITEASKTRLVVRHVPWFLGGFMALMGAAAIYAAIFKSETFKSSVEAMLVPSLGVAALAGAWWFAPVVTLVFDRKAGRVIFREGRLMRRSAQVFDLDSVERVQLQAHYGDSSKLFRLALRTTEGVTPLETGYTSADREQVKDAINRWLAGNAPDAPSTKQGPTVRR